MIVNLINFARFRFRQLFGEERDGPFAVRIEEVLSENRANGELR
jgi:hypothetical protein